MSARTSRGYEPYARKTDGGRVVSRIFDFFLEFNFNRTRRGILTESFRRRF